MVDITERRVAGEAPARLASFPELTPAPNFEVDPTGRRTYLNPAAERIFPDQGERGAEHPSLAGLDLPPPPATPRSRRSPAR